MLQQNQLDELVVVTSTSQFTPRALEPVYCATKAGLQMLANSLALDPRIGQTLVATPAGMKSGFWRGTDRDLADMLEPQWVAEQILFFV